jgi:hypothetical protein
MIKSVLIWFSGASLIAILLVQGYPIEYWELSHRSVSTRGVVTRLEPRNHQAVHYSFEVAGRSYERVGRAEFGNPQFGFLSVGQPVFVYYLPENPYVSCMGYPADLLKNEEVSIFLASFIMPIFVLVVCCVKYPKFRSWLVR